MVETENWNHHLKRYESFKRNLFFVFFNSHSFSCSCSFLNTSDWLTGCEWTVSLLFFFSTVTVKWKIHDLYSTIAESFEYKKYAYIETKYRWQFASHSIFYLRIEFHENVLCTMCTKCICTNQALSPLCIKSSSGFFFLLLHSNLFIYLCNNDFWNANCYTFHIIMCAVSVNLEKLNYRQHSTSNHNKFIQSSMQSIFVLLMIASLYKLQHL